MIGSNRRGVGPRRGRAVVVVGAIAASAVMAFGVGTANAATATFSASFDDAALSLPVLGSSDILEPPQNATMTGTIPDDSVNPASFTVQAVGFHFPDFSGTANGIPLTVKFEATAPITGTVSPTTGAVSTAASAYKATVSALGSNCVYNVTQGFSSGAGSPFSGDAFTVDTTTTPGTWALSQGILQTGWSSLPASGGGGACDTIDTIVTSGPGGLELGNGFDLTPAPPPSGTPVTPAPKKKCKKKKKKKSASRLPRRRSARKRRRSSSRSRSDLNDSSRDAPVPRMGPGRLSLRRQPSDTLPQGRARKARRQRDWS